MPRKAPSASSKPVPTNPSLCGEEVPCLSPEGCGIDYECFRKERDDFFKEVKRLAKEREADERKMDDNP